LEPGTKETGTAEAVPAKARPLKKAHEGNWTKIPPGGGCPPLDFRGSKPDRLFVSGALSVAESLSVNNADCHCATLPCSAIQFATSSDRQAVILADNLTG
jgi:hypothetical protein